MTDRIELKGIRALGTIGVLAEEQERAQPLEVDGYNNEHKIVLEIEVGRAYTNYQFLKDIFEASVMVDVEYLVLAVRTIYNNHEDYNKITDWLETLFVTKRIQFDLKGLLVIGY